jgi:ribosomal protein S18 acetylase RimI-like enzyme
MVLHKPIADGLTIRQADWKDAIPIQYLLKNQSKVHRYLDWRNPLEWLGLKPFLILEKQDKLQAVLACPMDPDYIAWVRLFACSWEIASITAWDLLTKEALYQLSTTTLDARCYILALEDWIERLVHQKKYPKHQEITILQKLLTPLVPSGGSVDLIIREMTLNDLPEVAVIDARSFEDLWVYSLPTLQLAFQQSEISYIALIECKPVGYLLGTISDQVGHLARIAVLPENKRHQVATHLIERFIIDLADRNITLVTLNTQSNNQASLALYDKMGFQRTGETFGVYQIL